jgi:NAD(P)-dependent dehydrogenase (short-subunit alcohol dehydrogenase family)
MHFNNLNLTGIYTPRLGYAQSKTANILMANELNRRYASKGVNATSASPGAIRTRAQRHDDPAELEKMLPMLEKVLKDPGQGAATQVWAAVGKAWEGKGGLYLEDCGVGRETEDATPMFRGGYAGYAFDPVAEKKLWEVSCKLVGVENEGV